MGLISGRKAFQRPMAEGVKLLNAIQDVYLCVAPFDTSSFDRVSLVVGQRARWASEMLEHLRCHLLKFLRRVPKAAFRPAVGDEVLLTALTSLVESLSVTARRHRRRVPPRRRT